jgi:uncharacterized protein involved in outer membrane biogenesis
MKFIFKWLLRLFLLAVVLIVIFFLSLNSILRVVIEHNIRAQTGMDAEIGKFSLRFIGPTIEIKDLKIYNPPSFGGTLFLDIPEIHADFDRAALLRREFHLTLLRFNLGELDIVKNEAGRTNIFSLGGGVPVKNPGGGQPKIDFKKQTGYDFKSVDVLTVWIGTAKYIDLKDQRNNRTQKIDIEGWPLRNVKSPADLMPLMVFAELRSNYFFTSILGPKNLQKGNPATLQDISKLIGIAF